MIDPSETLQRLLALANDERGAIEERKTAALQATALMQKHSLVPGASLGAPASDPLGERLDRLNRLGERHERTAATRAMLNGVSERVWELYPRGKHCTGRPELAMLLISAVGIAHMIAIDPERPPQQEVGEFLGLLPTVLRAFNEWAAQQPVPASEQIQAEIMKRYREWRHPLPSIDRIACAIGVPSPTVADALNALVEQEKLRCKSGDFTVVRRRTRPKSKMVQEDLFR